MVARKKQPMEFSDSQLSKLTEPIKVYVEKVVNGRRSPIELPVKPGESSSGAGWTKDEVRALSSFLANDWSGGGLYVATATGSTGEEMKWEMFFHPQQYPEKHNPLMPPAPQRPPAAVQPGFSGPFAGPAGHNWMQQAAAMAPPMGFSSPWQSSPMGFGFRPPPPIANESAQTAKLEAQIERERLENRYKEITGGLQQELRSMQQKLDAGPSKAESEALKAAQARIDALEKERSQNAIVQQMQQMQQQQMETMRQMREDTNKQMAQMAQMMNQNKGPDPMMMMMVESQKAQAAAAQRAAEVQADAQKEVARLNAESARTAQANAIGPTQVIDLMSRMGQSNEQVHQAFGKAWELMMGGVEAMLNAQGPPVHPALEMLQNAAQGGLGVAQRYVESKEREAMMAAQAAQADAAARAHEANARAAEAARGQQAAGPDPMLDGIEADEGEGDEEGDGGTAEAPPPTREQQMIAISQQIEAMADPDRWAVAWESIQKMRAAVKSGMLSPEQTAQALMQGIDHFVPQGAQIPVLHFWKTGELSALIDAMVPAAPLSFKEQLAAILFEIRNQQLAEVEKMKAAQQDAAAAAAKPANTPANANGE